MPSARSFFNAASWRTLNVSDLIHHRNRSYCSLGLSLAAAALISSNVLMAEVYHAGHTCPPLRVLCVTSFSSAPSARHHPNRSDTFRLPCLFSGETRSLSGLFDQIGR